ncbi:hypothetical protein HYZ98_03690 [Candidatus Peregrinibacteria bacterium]|nr:hypothetical protein [Candidatus Peregrinibacteria bacterium]
MKVYAPLLYPPPQGEVAPLLYPPPQGEVAPLLYPPPQGEVLLLEGQRISATFEQMSVHKGRDNRGEYYQCGNHGKKYRGRGAVAKAARQGRAAYAHGYRGQRT